MRGSGQPYQPSMRERFHLKMADRCFWALLTDAQKEEAERLRILHGVDEMHSRGEMGRPHDADFDDLPAFVMIGSRWANADPPGQSYWIWPDGRSERVKLSDFD